MWRSGRGVGPEAVGGLSHRVEPAGTVQHELRGNLSSKVQVELRDPPKLE